MKSMTVCGYNSAIQYTGTLTCIVYIKYYKIFIIVSWKGLIAGPFQTCMDT